MRPRLLALLAACLAQTLPAAALELVGPRLSAASNFSQTWAPGPLSGAADISMIHYRDEILWQYIEQDDGSLAFRSRREAYPSMLQARDAEMMFLVYTGHPKWEGGYLPLTPEGQAAFGEYTARIVERFPLITSVEVGNEFNAFQFAEAENWPDDLDTRAAAYVRLLEATKRAVHAVNPDIRILGGAAHSIPLAWIEPLMRHGAAKHMDAFVLHPYTTAPEQLARQIALMRQVPGMETMPLEMTEFGTTDADIAAGYFLRMYCQMAISGTSGATWYPFSHRGDGLIPLLEDDGSATDVGETYLHIRKRLEGRAVRNAAPDPFTYACQFDDRTLVIWGAPRTLELAAKGRVYAANGAELSAPYTLSRLDPLVVVLDDTPAEIGQSVRLAPQTVLADTIDQFAYPGGGLPSPFQTLVWRQGSFTPMLTRPGQERGGVPWTPYLGIDMDGTVRAAAEWALPAAWGADDPFKVVHRYRADETTQAKLVIDAAPSADTVDGITIEVSQNGVLLHSEILTTPGEITLDGLSLTPGDEIDVALGPNLNPEGDVTDLRITFLRSP